MLRDGFDRLPAMIVRGADASPANEAACASREVMSAFIFMNTTGARRSHADVLAERASWVALCRRLLASAAVGRQCQS